MKSHGQIARDQAKRIYQKKFTKPSMTKQAMKDECNINNIMRKFEKTGILAHVRKHQGNYGDFTDAPLSYHEAYQQILDAEEMFMEIPSSLRKKFNNDPGEFIAFVENPENMDEMENLGLLNASAVARRAASAQMGDKTPSSSAERSEPSENPPKGGKKATE